MRSADDRFSSMTSSIIFSYCMIAGVLVFTSVVHAQIPGATPGIDYPNYSYKSFPKTSFSCTEQKYIPGFYADVETNCQAFHFCSKDRQESFLCPVGAIFNQAILACDSWYSSNCSLAPLSYSVNAGPAIEGAERNLPRLIKLRNLLQENPAKQIHDILEKMSSLYEGSLDSTTAYEGQESSSSSPDLKKGSSTNIDKFSSEPSQNNEIASENQDGQSYGSLPEAEEPDQGDASSEDETYKGDEYEVDERMEPNIVYDPVTDGYYMDYDRYRTDWQQDSEFASDEFKKFYGNQADGYRAMFQDYDDSSEDESEVLAEPEGMNLNDVGYEATDNTEFSKRYLQQSKRYRRRPMYIVLEDGESPENGYVADESGSPYTQQVAGDGVYEDATELPGGDATEGTSEIEGTSEENKDESEEVLKSLQFPYRRVYQTEEPLTSQEFEHAILTELAFPPGYDGDDVQRDTEELTLSEHEQMYSEHSPKDVLTDFQGDDQSLYAEDVEGYESDSPEYDYQDDERDYQESDFQTESYQNSQSMYRTEAVEPEVPGEDADNTFVVEPEVPGEDAENTFVVIPEESDIEVTDSDEDETRDEHSVSEYAYEEIESNEQTDEESQSDDAYEYYESYQEYPDAVDPTSFQRPEYYFRDYEGRRFIPNNLYQPGSSEYSRLPYEAPGVSDKTNGEPGEIDYSNYTPEVARLAYLSFMRNAARTNREYRLRRKQQDQPMSYTDPVYGTENGYAYGRFYDNPYGENDETPEYYESEAEGSDYYSQPDRFYDNPYDENDETPEYYESESSDYYSQPDPAWFQQDSPEYVDMENESDVSDTPLPVDVAESDFENSDEMFGSSVGSEETADTKDLKDFAPEDQNNEQTEETYYVFDFDEDNEKQLDGEESNMDAAISDFDFNKSPDLGGYFNTSPDLEGYSEMDSNKIHEAQKFPPEDESVTSNISFHKDSAELPLELSKSKHNVVDSLDTLLTSQNGDVKSDPLATDGTAYNLKPITDSWSPFSTESSLMNDKPVTLSSALERLATLKAVKAPQVSSVDNLDISSDSRFLNMGFPETMHFDPYGYGTNMGKQFGMVDTSQPNKPVEFSHRTGETEQTQTSKLSAIQERLRSMKQGKFGVFRKYMNSVKN